MLSLTGDWTRDLPHSKPALYHSAIEEAVYSGSELRIVCVHSPWRWTASFFNAWCKTEHDFRSDHRTKPARNIQYSKVANKR